MSNRFILVDPHKCIGCKTCEIACVVAHREDPDMEDVNVGDFTPRIHVLEAGKITAAVTCRQCLDSPCANSCPNGAISREQGVMIVNPDQCIGCQTCVVACPFGAMEVVDYALIHRMGATTVKAKAHKCNLCLGRPEGPACIQHCPTDALHIVDRELQAKMIAEKRLRTALENPSF
ncbi:4Fe-4S dicluster domain-containing protein [Acetobacteraceae bacterium]|nr:4Fe-4S dicluster domain-containing protein [Acetobacteraceae bacterium]